MRLSILIPSIPERFEAVIPLVDKLQKQSEGKEVEILLLCDNKKMSIGSKRQKLKELAIGEYWAFVDDDDDISEDYIDQLLKGCESCKDVITFHQWSTINGEGFLVQFGLDYENQDATQVDGQWKNIKRSPFHVCAWKSSVVKNCFFSDKNYGEDWDFCKFAIKEVISEHNIPKILHYYKYDDQITQAFESDN